MTYLVSLRKITAVDADLIVKWRNENKKYFPPQSDFTIISHMQWHVNQYLLNPADHYYLVRVNAFPAGTIAFNSKTSEIGRVLLGEKKYERQGVMSEALRLLKGSFSTGRYWLRVLAHNSEAIAFYERNGFFVTKGEGEMVRMEST